nr:hypothetical protein [Tanacetum cinerariifolium]
MSSDEASSGVTYTSISIRRMHAPPSLDYVPGPEEPEQAPLSLNYVPGPEYPKYLALYDAEILVEHQPYAADDSPIALSLGYIADSDPEEDLDDESEDGPTEYPDDGGDDDDDSSRDDVDEEDQEEASEEDDEEEEHLAPADSIVVFPTVDPVPSAKETKPFETDESAATPPPPPPPPAYHTTAKMSVRSRHLYHFLLRQRLLGFLPYLYHRHLYSFHYHYHFLRYHHHHYLYHHHL